MLRKENNHNWGHMTGVHKNLETFNNTKVKMAVEQLDTVISSKDEKLLSPNGLLKIKRWIITAGYTKAQITAYLVKFSEAYSSLAASNPIKFVKNFSAIHNMVHEKKKEFEELIVFPNKEKEGKIISYLDKAKMTVKI